MPLCLLFCIASVLLAPLSTQPASALPTSVHHGAIGYFEGTRRTARCPEGRFTGVELHMAGDPAHVDAYFLGLRLLCAGGKINVQYTGTVSDKQVWGAATYSIKKGLCTYGNYVTGLRWRIAEKTSESETRAAGLTVVCSGGHPRLFRLDNHPGKEHDQWINCAMDVPKQPLEALDLWWSPRGLSGMKVLCVAPAS